MNSDSLGLAVIGTALLALSACNSATPAERDTYSAILTTASGNEYVLEHDVSHTDCVRFIADMPSGDARCEPDKPRLIGYGCEGEDGPRYAAEEDELPACKRIEQITEE